MVNEQQAPVAQPVAGPAMQAVVPVNRNGLPICGSHKKGKPATDICQNTAGQRTDHQGQGRCWLHGGRGGRPIVHGRYSKQLNTTLADRMADFLESPQLLSLNNEVALLKSMLEIQVDDYSRYMEELSQYEDIMANWDDKGDGKPPPKPRPASLDPETMRLVINAVKTQHEMQFARRFSVPIAEVHAFAQQVGMAFAEICDEYAIPPEAKLAMAERLKRIKVSRGTDDENMHLYNEGGGRVHSDIPTDNGTGFGEPVYEAPDDDHD